MARLEAKAIRPPHGLTSSDHLHTPLRVPPSIDRQPPRKFEDSPAVRFTLRRTRKWSPDGVPETVCNEITGGLDARDRIRRAHSQLECAVFDVLWEAASKAAIPERVPLDRDGRYATLRRLADPGGPLAAQRSFLLRHADRMQDVEDHLGVIVFGFLEIHEARTGNISFRFELGADRSTCSAQELQRRANRIEAFAAAALPQLKLISRGIRCSYI